MVKFLDGPAAGVELSLRRIPILLRAVRARNGQWDALDQLDDEPKVTETIVIYKRQDGFSRYHLKFSGSLKRESGFYWNASYSVLAEQPADAAVRTTAAWRQWASALMSHTAASRSASELRASLVQSHGDRGVTA